MKRMLTIIALGISSVSALQAQSSEGFWSGRFEYNPGQGAYVPREFSLDLLGQYATRSKGGADKDAVGFGAGVNFFFTRNIGVGVDTYAQDFEVPYLINASLLYRYPISETGLAPYGMVGFGRQWDHAAQWMGHAGLGLEYRLNQRTGVFLDARRVFADVTKDYAVWRAGLRLAF